MHEKRQDCCAQVTGGKPPQVGQGSEGGRIRNFTDSALRRAVVLGGCMLRAGKKQRRAEGGLMRDSLSRKDEASENTGLLLMADVV